MSLFFLRSLTSTGFNKICTSLSIKGYQIRDIFSTEKQKTSRILKNWEKQLDKNEKERVETTFTPRADLLNKYPSDSKFQALAQRVAHKYEASAIRHFTSSKDVLKENALDTLTQSFKAFQKKNPFQEGEVVLKERQTALLNEVCEKYPTFANLLLEKESLKTKFFNEVLIYNFPLDVYVEFPALHTQLKVSLLDKRIAFFNDPKKEKLLQIEKNKDVTLLVAGGTRVSLLTEEEVKINTTTLKVKSLFQEFSNKRLSSGKYELGEKGVHEVDVFQFAKDKVEKTPLEFLKEIPLHMTMTQEEVEKKYGKKLEKGEWGFSCNASRESPDFTLMGTHAFGDIIVPAEKIEEGAKEGAFKVYSFGLFAEKFPEGCLEMIGVLGVTLKGAITCFDENNFRLDRQRVFLCENISEEKGLQVVEAIQEEIKKQKTGDVVFQISAHNCACFVNNISEKVFRKEGPYALSFNDYKPVGPLKIVFSVGKFLNTRVSEKVGRIWFQCILLALGAKRKYKNTVSVFSHLFDKEKLVGYHPANILKKPEAVTHNGFIEVS